MRSLRAALNDEIDEDRDIGGACWGWWSAVHSQWFLN